VKEIIWLSPELVIAIHQHQLNLFGGASGLRDRGLLDAALSRPLNKFHYENAGLASLSAAYAYGLVRDHPFVDGNKRVALLALITFLGLNNHEFVASEAEAVIMMRSLASGDVEEEAVTAWIERNMRPVILESLGGHDHNSTP
jgi:death-on-curing protein